MTGPAPVVVERVTYTDHRTDTVHVRTATAHHDGTPTARRNAIARTLQHELLSVSGYAAPADPPRAAGGGTGPRSRIAAAQATGTRNTAQAEIRWSGPDGRGRARVSIGTNAQRFAGHLTFETITTMEEA